jgi:hypothetical protein
MIFPPFESGQPICRFLEIHEMASFGAICFHGMRNPDRKGAGKSVIFDF